MRVILMAAISGTRNGLFWPPPGGQMDLPADEAADMIRNFLAVAAPDPVAEEAPEEVAVIDEPTERATKPVTKAKFRGRK